MSLNVQAGFRSDAYTPDRLIADDADSILGKGITLISGQTLVRGAVLGQITASGKYTLALSASSDGSQNPTVILAQDCDASAGDAAGVAFFSGTFNSAALTLGTGITAAAAATALRSLSINIVDSVGGV